MHLRKLYRYNNNLYIILRELPHSSLIGKDGKVKTELFNAWKSWLGADHVLKNSTHFLFCETVPEAEYEDIPNTDESE